MALSDRINQRSFSPADIKAGKHIDDWPEAKSVFDGLNRSEQSVLRQIARGKALTYRNEGAVNSLRDEGLIEGKGADIQLARDYFKDFIFYNHTFKGEISKISKKPWRILGQLKEIHLYLQRPGVLTFIAMFLFSVPLFLSASLMYLCVREFLTEALISSEEWLSIGRDYGLFGALVFALLFTLNYLFSSRTDRRPPPFLATFLALGTVLSLLFWLGFSFSLIIPLLLFIFCDFAALWCLNQGSKKLLNAPSRKDVQPPLRRFLKEATSSKTWENMKQWPQSKALVLLALFVPGFFLFFYSLAPQKTDFQVGSVQAEFLYPSWLSYRDEGDFLVSLYSTSAVPMTTTVFLEPEDTPFLRFSLEKPDQYQATVLLGDKQHYQTLRWRIHTPPGSALNLPSKWQVRLKAIADGQEKEESIGIGTLKLGFGLWGFLEHQSLLNIFSIIFGIVYASIGILVSNWLIFDDE